MTMRDSLGGQNGGRRTSSTGSSPVPSIFETIKRTKLFRQLQKLDRAIGMLDRRIRMISECSWITLEHRKLPSWREERYKLDQQRMEVRRARKAYNASTKMS